jgi:predicted RNA-binding protein with PUA-like domain
VPKAHHLVKSEPGTYSFADLVRDKKTVWDGIRNPTARNNLRQMQKDDLVLFYHTGDEKQIVGIAKVVKTAYPDPSAEEGEWLALDLAAVKPIAKPVTLATIKSDKKLAQLPLVKMSRLSVMPVGPKEFEHIVGKLGGTKL